MSSRFIIQRLRIIFRTITSPASAHSLTTMNMVCFLPPSWMVSEIVCDLCFTLWCSLSLKSSAHIVAFRTMIPSVINSMDRIANTSDTLKLAYQAISYKPFLSLFNMTGVASTYPELAGVGMSYSSRPSI